MFDAVLNLHIFSASRSSQGYQQGSNDQVDVTNQGASYRMCLQSPVSKMPVSSILHVKPHDMYQHMYQIIPFFFFWVNGVCCILVSYIHEVPRRSQGK